MKLMFGFVPEGAQQEFPQIMAVMIRENRREEESAQLHVLYVAPNGVSL